MLQKKQSKQRWRLWGRNTVATLKPSHWIVMDSSHHASPGCCRKCFLKSMRRRPSKSLVSWCKNLFTFKSTTHLNTRDHYIFTWSELRYSLRDSLINLTCWVGIVDPGRATCRNVGSSLQQSGVVSGTSYTILCSSRRKLCIAQQARTILSTTCGFWLMVVNNTRHLLASLALKGDKKTHW